MTIFGLLQNKQKKQYYYIKNFICCHQDFRITFQLKEKLKGLHVILRLNNQLMMGLMMGQ